MENLHFGLNQKIEFIGAEGEIGTSLVQDWGKDSFLVTIPLKGSQKKLLAIGDSITGIYYDQNDKVFMFESKVLERVVQNIPLYKLNMPSRLRKLQRRDHVRIPVSIPITYMKIPRKAKSHSVDDLLKGNGITLPVKWETGIAKDLSGGGICIRTLNPIENDIPILITVDTDKLQLTVKGISVRSDRKIRSGQVTYCTGLKFIQLLESERDKVIGFIFSEFRNRKQKGV